MCENPLISVVVPIFNVEKYLERCVQSIRCQTYSNIEIILVDDGSTDCSGNICDFYKNQDKRIKVIHKQNGGLSDARNVGIKLAQGEYLTCVDSDDFISTLFVENLWRAVKEGHCDIATSWFVEFYEGDIIPKSEKVECKDIQVIDRERFYERLLYQKGVEVSAWGKLYKSELFQNIEYPKGKLYEDIPTTYLLIEKVTNIAVIPNIDYFYFQRKNSIAQSQFSIKKMDAIYYMNNFKNFITINYPSLKRAAECRYFSTLCNILFQIQDAEFVQQKKELWNEVKKYRVSVLTNHKARKKSRLAAFISFFGYKLMKNIYILSESRN